MWVAWCVFIMPFTIRGCCPLMSLFSAIWLTTGLRKYPLGSDVPEVWNSVRGLNIRLRTEEFHLLGVAIFSRDL